MKIADLASSASGLAQIWSHEGQSQANFNKCVKSCRLSAALKTGIIEARAAKTPLNVDVSEPTETQCHAFAQCAHWPL